MKIWEVLHELSKDKTRRFKYRASNVEIELGFNDNGKLCCDYVGESNFNPFIFELGDFKLEFEPIRKEISFAEAMKLPDKYKVRPKKKDFVQKEHVFQKSHAWLVALSEDYNYTEMCNLIDSQWEVE